MREEKLTNMVFLPGQIPSLKNSKVMGRFHSETVTRWLRRFGISYYSASKKQVKKFKKIQGEYDFYEIVKPLFNDKMNYPILIGFHFVRETKRTWDFVNICQIILDLLTAHDLIPDDNVNYILPIPMRMENVFYSIDKEKPGVYIKILNDIKYE